MAQPDQAAAPAWAWGGARSVDLRCLNEADTSVVTDKPYFSAVAELLDDLVRRHPRASVLDIGCSTGAFVAYLLHRWPELRLTGVDVLAPVVEAARRSVPGAWFAEANLLDPATLPGGFDAVTMLGIHSLFDEPGCWIDPAVGALKPGGTLLTFGLFNPEPVDVLVRMRDNRPAADGKWQTGWNTWSRDTVERELERRGLRRVWHEYTLPRRTERWSSDPLHSWTAIVDGVAMTLNGGQLLHRHAILEVTRA